MVGAITFELPNLARGPSIPKETMDYANGMLPICAKKGNGIAEMIELALKHASSEPDFEHGPRIFGDSSERSDTHPIYVNWSNRAFPMVLPH